MELTPIESLSPTLAWRLIECPHAVGLQRQQRGASMAAASQSPAVSLGNAAHTVIARALQDEPLGDQLDSSWYQHAWQEAVEREREHCGDENAPERWRRHNIIKRGARRIADELRSEAASRGATPVVERTLEASLRNLHGRPDVILSLPNGTAEVVDVKTGTPASGEPTDRELLQLHLYKALVEEALSLPVTALRLTRCDGPSWRGTPSAAAVDRIVDRALSARDRFNAHLSDTVPLAQTGPHCSRCRLAPCSRP